MDQISIIILHGWQSKLSRWEPLTQILKKDFTIFLPEIPGFGQIKTDKPWNLKDYADWLKQYLRQNKITNPIIIGHSFGGRVALKYLSAGGQAKKLILIASAGINQKNNFKKTIFWYLAKTGKFFFKIPWLSAFKKQATWFIYTVASEKDYYLADSILKETMKKVISENLESELGKIKTPTLILWGQDDKITPPSDAHIFNRKIPKSYLKIYKRAGHNLPFILAGQVAREIINFVKNDS